MTYTKEQIVNAFRLAKQHKKERGEELRKEWTALLEQAYEGQISLR